MTARPEGTPTWADAMFPDLEAAKRFYGDLLGWTFDEGTEEFGRYTQAYAAGQPAAGLAPQMPGMEHMPVAWTLYLETPDADATARRIGEQGGQVPMGPMEVGDFGTMAIAADPAGVVFGLWQPGSHTGFRTVGEPGTFCWAEVNTREAEKTDAFFPAVFGYDVQQMQNNNEAGAGAGGGAGEGAGSMDYRVWSLGGEQPLMGRMAMTDEYFPADMPSHVNVCFAVDDCDRAVETAGRHGGSVLWGPEDSPFGRLATVRDPQGATCTVVDVSRTVGEMPQFV